MLVAKKLCEAMLIQIKSARRIFQDSYGSCYLVGK
jgi:hypothetical protein